MHFGRSDSYSVASSRVSLEIGVARGRGSLVLWILEKGGKRTHSLGGKRAFGKILGKSHLHLLLIRHDIRMVRRGLLGPIQAMYDTANWVDTCLFFLL